MKEVLICVIEDREEQSRAVQRNLALRLGGKAKVLFVAIASVTDCRRYIEAAERPFDMVVSDLWLHEERSAIDRLRVWAAPEKIDLRTFEGVECALMLRQACLADRFIFVSGTSAIAADPISGKFLVEFGQDTLLVSKGDKVAEGDSDHFAHTIADHIAKTLELEGERE